MCGVNLDLHFYNSLKFELSQIKFNYNLLTSLQFTMYKLRFNSIQYYYYYYDDTNTNILTSTAKTSHIVLGPAFTPVC